MQVRIDKYLFAVRFFKTRSLAADNCRLGKISVNNVVSKASKEVKVGDIINIKMHGYSIVLKVVEVLEKRLSASLAVNYYSDITPEEELIKKEMTRSVKIEYRERGTGRPTKKERRQIDGLKNNP